MNATHILPQQPCTCFAEIERLRKEIARLEWDETVGMFNSAGGYRAIDALDDSATYALVFCDIDYLKAINSATKDHIKTNIYIAAGLKVRPGEIAIRLMGDEFLFILTRQPRAPISSSFDRRRQTGMHPRAFIGRLQRQLAEQPLTESERAGLPTGVLSATFAYRANIAKRDIRATIQALSNDVLRQKEAR